MSVAESIETRPSAEADGPVQEPPARSRGTWGPRLGALAAILGGGALIAIHGAFYGHWIMDDAAITFAYSRNVADGYGPVLQPGAAPVEGYSNPTWMLLLALGKLVGLFDHGALLGTTDLIVFPKALALACCLGVLVLFYFGAKVLTSRPRLVTFLAGATLAAIPSFVIWVFSGLENSFYALTIAALAVLLIRAVAAGRLLSPKVALGAGLIAAAAALTRPDGLIYAGAFPLVVALFTSRETIGAGIRSVLLSAVGFVVPVGGYMVFRWFEFGRLVPNTAVAKGQPVPGLEDLAKVSDVVAYAGWLTVAVVVACLAIVMTRPSALRTRLIGVLVPFALAVAGFVIIDGDWMGQLRFATPIWTLGAFLGAVVVTEAFAAARIRGRVLLACALVVAAVISVDGFYTQGKAYRANVKTPMCWVAERDAFTINGFADILKLPDTASVGVIDLGGQALASRLRVFDIAGLGDKVAADYLHDADLQGLRDYTFNVVKPTFITFTGSWDNTLQFPTDPRFDRDYALIFSAPWVPTPVVDGRLKDRMWVRRDAVTPAQLDQLGAYANQRLPGVLALDESAPRRGCGPTLHPGTTG